MGVSPASPPLDFLDLVSLGAARRHDLDRGTLGLANECAGEWGGDRNLTLLGICLRLADDLPYPALVGILVNQRDGGTKLDRVAGQLRYVDDFGAREPILELGDAALVKRLGLFGSVILGVLRQVAMRARIRDLLDDARPLDLLAVLELVLEHGVARRRHRNLVHQSFGPSASERALGQNSDRGPNASGRTTAESVPNP